MAKKKARKPNKPYELPAPFSCRAEKLIIGCDPGSRSFGIALVGLEKNRIRVYANAVMMTPVDSLVEFNRSSSDFLDEIGRWVALGGGVDGFVAERFQESLQIWQR